MAIFVAIAFMLFVTPGHASSSDSGSMIYASSAKIVRSRCEISLSILEVRLHTNIAAW